MALHSGLGPVGLNFGSQKKLRTVTGAVICRKDLALINDRGMKRHKARGERRARGPMRSGSCNLDAVFDSSANAASSHGLIIVGLWAGSGGRSGDWLLLKGRCGFSALARLRIDYAVLFVSFL